MSWRYDHAPGTHSRVTAANTPLRYIIKQSASTYFSAGQVEGVVMGEVGDASRSPYWQQVEPCPQWPVIWHAGDWPLHLASVQLNES